MVVAPRVVRWMRSQLQVAELHTAEANCHNAVITLMALASPRVAPPADGRLSALAHSPAPRILCLLVVGLWGRVDLAPGMNPLLTTHD